MLTKTVNDLFEHLGSALTGVSRSATKPCAEGHSRRSFKDHHGKVLILIIVGIPQGELLLAVSRIIRGIKIDNHATWLLQSRTDKGVDEKCIEVFDAINLCTLDFEDNIAVRERLLRFTPSERILKTIHR